MDPRPIHERVDLTYVHRRHWPRSISGIAALVLMVMFGLVVVLMAVSDNSGIYTSGDLTSAHAMFGSACDKCHQAVEGRSGFWRPVSDSACLSCHGAPLHAPGQTEFVGTAHTVPGHSDAVIMSADCASCHVEHKGETHDLAAVSDMMCVRCHSDIEKHRAPKAGSIAEVLP